MLIVLFQLFVFISMAFRLICMYNTYDNCQIMTDTFSYNLTDHVHFRELQLQCSKLRDENAQLKSKLETIEQFYKQSINQHEKQKVMWLKVQSKLKSEIFDIRQQLEGLLSYTEQTYKQLKSFEKMDISAGQGYEERQTKRSNLNEFDNFKSKLNSMLNWSLMMMNKNNDIALKYERQIEKYKSQSKLYKKSENQLKEEISYLSEEITKLENLNMSVVNELSQVKRQNMDFKLKIYEFNKKDESFVHQKQKEIIEDNNFALDILHYQKQLLQRILSRLISYLQNQSINQALTEIYHCYETVAEIYRQKLQIEYDLEDLEKEYKREKSSKVSESLLIELRKQIQEFRNQLHKQKQILSKQEENLENSFINIQAAEREDKRMRNCTIQMNKKLKDIKSYNQTKRAGSNQLSRQQSQSRIKFKVTSTNEDLMNEIVKKDRQNIDKIFKQTRNNYRMYN